MKHLWMFGILMMLWSQTILAQQNDTILYESEVVRVEIPSNNDAFDNNWVHPNPIPLEQKNVEKIKKMPFNGFVRLVKEEKQTVLHCYVCAGTDELVRLWLGGQDTYIVDTQTGTRYRARGSYDPRFWEQNSGVKTKKGTILDFPIYFPPLPSSVKYIKIYGVPAWNLRGRDVRLNRSKARAYDDVPHLRMPQLEKPALHYNKDDMSTYAWYKDAHLLAPMPEYTMAIWLTPEATYLAIAHELNWTQEYFSVEPKTVIVDNVTGKTYKLRKVQGLPMKDLFFIHGVSGDLFAMVLEFEPLPLKTVSINYIEADGEPFHVWGANWRGEQFYNLSVDEMRDNQKLFEYYERKIVE